jgi:hypothetical protein
MSAIMSKMQGSALGMQRAAAQPLAVRPRVARSARPQRAGALLVRAEAKNAVAKVRWPNEHCAALSGRPAGERAKPPGPRVALPFPAPPASSPLPPAPSRRAQFADSIGLPTDEGIFGFRPFAEVGAAPSAAAGH